MQALGRIWRTAERSPRSTRGPPSAADPGRMTIAPQPASALPSTGSVPASARSTPGTQPRLSARGLVKTFGPTTALAGVDVELADGESLAVMGPSGSDKSTLPHCMAGILRPDTGTVALRGREVAGLGERERSLLRRRQHGFVFQFGQLLSELPAQEDVALPLMLLGTPRAKAVTLARQWLVALGLAGMEERRPGEMSGGRARRRLRRRADRGARPGHRDRRDAHPDRDDARGRCLPRRRDARGVGRRLVLAADRDA